MKPSEFIDKFVNYLEKGTASIFVGAGLSHEAGYPTWALLLKDAAKELRLDVSLEHDLAGLAQYFLNRHGRNRTKIAQLVKREFSKPGVVPAVLRHIAWLPVRHIWTTNYDTLIEQAWHLSKRRLDVKSRNSDLPTDDPWAEAILYKMHGSVDHPADVVIAKDDYELYRRTRQGFLHVLLGDLVARHMLFLGFSFRDPNVSHLFSMIREAFGDSPPEHYAIVKRPPTGSSATARYDRNRHRLWVEDLERYGINCIEVEQYAENAAILQEIKSRLTRRSILVSGSFPEVGFDPNLRQKIVSVAELLGDLIVRRGSRLVSGFGLVVGGRVIAGAIARLLSDDFPNLEKALLLRPFPQSNPPGFTREKFFALYREDLLLQAGICIFVGGFRKKLGTGDDIEIAPGVLAEFDTARKLSRLIIPIGATGGAAESIWGRMNGDNRNKALKIPDNLFSSLNNNVATPRQLVATVEKILKWYERQRTA